jgi:ABC-2 type transport system permease protein
MKNLQLQDKISKLLLSLAIIVVVAVALSFKHTRIDFTSEKRYTLANISKTTLRELDDIVYVKVYLDGKLNTQLKRLQITIRETLDEFRIYGKDNIHYEFINPSDAESEELRNEKYKELYAKGLIPVNIKDTDEEGEESEKIIFPGAIIHYKNASVAVNLLKNNQLLSSEENLSNSRQSLEYELINMIINITSKKVDKIAFIEGHGELNEWETAGITRELANFFQVDRGIINGNYGVLDAYKAIVIAKPSIAFSEADKFVIDQYIMKGGKVLWFIDPVKIDLDSLVMGSTVAMPNDLNLDDMLFKYGVRVNQVLVKDINSNVIPINTALAGAKADFTPTKWPYFPLLQGNPEHVTGKKLNLIAGRFTSSLDPIGDSLEVRKTVLLSTSPNSKSVNTPAFVSLDELQKAPSLKEFNQSNLPVAILLQGTFSSVFQNRILQQVKPDSAAFKNKSPETSMLVVGDGDIIRNEVRYTAQGPVPMPLGFDNYTKQTYGNKDFILNVVNYITGNKELIQLRSREFKLRLLNEEMYKAEKTKWQVLNLVLPILLVILFGISFAYERKRKYAAK